MIFGPHLGRFSPAVQAVLPRLLLELLRLLLPLPPLLLLEVLAVEVRLRPLRLAPHSSCGCMVRRRRRLPAPELQHLGVRTIRTDDAMRRIVGESQPLPWFLSRNLEMNINEQTHRGISVTASVLIVIFEAHLCGVALPTPATLHPLPGLGVEAPPSPRTHRLQILRATPARSATAPRRHGAVIIGSQ
jgi:hypothetical protein